MAFSDNFIRWLPRWFLLVDLAFLLAVVPTLCHGQSNAILRLSPDGPIAPIHALQFSFDGTRLYAAGDEKLIQVWQINEQDRFERSHAESLRHLIGPGPLGNIRAMSVSEDGRFVVAGGVGTFNDHAGFAVNGIMIPGEVVSREVLQELGTVSLFDTQNHTTSRIKSHPGYVIATAVVSQPNLDAPYLVTIGVDQEPIGCASPKNASNVTRSLRLIRLPDGQLVQQWPLPVPPQPTLTVWTTTDAKDASGLRIAVTVANNKVGDGIDLFKPGTAEPKRIVDRLAVAADRVGVSDKLVFASEIAPSKRGLRIVDTADIGDGQAIDLTQQLGRADFIFSLACVRNKPSLVAITLRDLATLPTSLHRLQIVDTERKQLVLGAGIALGNQQNPIIAADPTGRFIAATADVARGIQIFKVDDLRIGKTAPFQVLRPDFQPINRATLVAIDDTNVLRIQTHSDDQTKTYDFSQDSLRPVDGQRWPDVEQQRLLFGWDSGAKQWTASASDGTQMKRTNVKIEASSMPIGKQIQCKRLDGQSLAAIAFLQSGGESQAQLSLFDPKSGIEYRRLDGHQQIVTSIEFSEDQRHLTTVSADGMVCVWPLSDLTDLVGKRATIRGVQWCFDNGKPTVSEFEDDRHAKNSLQINDQVLGLVDVGNNNQKIEFETLDQLLVAVSHYDPKQLAPLWILRDQRRWRVWVRLEQGTDERKPLFSFISRVNPESKQLDWLAWTPHGPFQSNGPEIEQRAGWHFNPDTDNPTARFAPLAQFRNEFYGDSLIDQLLALGHLPEVWPPLLEAEVSACLVDDRNDLIYADGVLFQPDHGPREIRVAVSGIPPSFISHASAQFDGGDPFDLQRSSSDPGIWSQALPGPIDQTIAHTVSVTVDSKRIRDGISKQSWTIAPTKPIEADPPPVALREIKVTSHPPTCEVKMADLDAGSLVRVEAIVDADAIPPNWKLVGVNNTKEVQLRDEKRDGDRLRVSIPVEIGSNELALRLEDGNANSVTSDPITIDVFDSPEIEFIAGDVEPDNLGRVQLRVRAAHEPQLADFRMWLAGSLQDLNSSEISIGQPSIQQPNLFPVIFSKVPLAAGINRIELQLLDPQGTIASRKSLTLLGADQAKQPEMDVRLSDERTYSESIKIAVTLSDNVKQLSWQLVGAETVAVPLPDPGKRQEVEFEVPLQVQVNQIEISAVSSAGLKSTESLSVTRVEPPVELLVETFAAKGLDPIPLHQDLGRFYTSADPIPIARGELQGLVRTPRAVDVTKSWVRARVNGFLQSVVEFDPTDQPKQYRFRIPLLLSLEKNEIRLEFSEFVEDENLVADVMLECANPSTDQTLHLFIVNMNWPGGRKQAKAYADRVLESLGVVGGKMPAFSEVKSANSGYPALTGHDLSSDRLRDLINRCQFRLDRPDPMNNAVLIYFEGQELSADDGRFCLMTADATPDRVLSDDNNTLITSTYLGRFFRELKCANLLFLDVKPHPAGAQFAIGGDPRQSHLGVLRLTHANGTSPGANGSLIAQLEKLIPNVGELGQLTRQLKAALAGNQGLAFSESIDPPILRMRFGAKP